MVNTEVFFDANTLKFVASVDAATGAVNKQSAAVAEAKNKILEAMAAAEKAAKAAGASTTELTRIQINFASKLAEVTEQNATAVENRWQRVIDKQKRQAQELANFVPPSPPVEDHGEGITAKQRASAVLRGGGLRAGESFLTQFSAFNQLSAAVFPVLGVATLATEAFRAAEAFKAMYDTAKMLPEVLRDGFAEMSSPLELGADNLRKVNDELEITNAKLRHQDAGKPGAALAIDEIRISADKASDAARKAFLDVKKLLDANKVGLLQSLLTGTDPTPEVDDLIKSGFRQIADLNRQHKDRVRAGNDTPESDAQDDQKLALARAKLRYDITQEQSQRTGIVKLGDGTTAAYSAVNGNQDAALAKLGGAKDILDNQDDESEQQKRNRADEAANKDLQNRAKMAADAKAAKQKELQEAQKAIAAQRKQWQDQDDARKDDGKDSALIEVNTWSLRVMALKVGSEQYIYAQHELAGKLSELRKQDAEAAKQAAAKAEKDQRAAWDTDHAGWETAAHRTAADQADYWSIRVLEAKQGSENERLAWDKYNHAIEEQLKQADEATKARGKASLERGQQKAALEEATVAIEEQTGRISRQDALLQQAAIHAELYRQKMADLKQELDRQQALDPNSAGTVNAGAAIDKAQADRSVQVIQEAAQQAAASWQGALTNANNVWVQDAQDGAKQVTELYGQAINGLNAQIVNAVMRNKTSFGETFKSLGKTVAGDGLKQLEAPVLKALGIGKADGSKGNPLHVLVENLGSGGSGSGGIFSTGSGGGKGAGDVGDLASAALSFIPGGAAFAPIFAGIFGGHRALGGGVKAGMTYDVGEMGREEFTPATDGYITPTSQSSKGAAYYSIYMDGGVTPEQVHQQINSALAAVHPKVVRDASSAVLERQARRPRSAG